MTPHERFNGVRVDLPCLDVRLVPVVEIRPNSYNPNRMSSARRDLLRRSIEFDGVTQPVVLHGTPDDYVVVDGFHRFKILKDWFALAEIPAVVIAPDFASRVVATVAHNRARGKHRIGRVRDLIRQIAEVRSDRRS